MAALRRCRRRLAAVLVLAGLAPGACGEADTRTDPLAAIPRLPFTVEQRLPHDRTLFTQGIAFAGELLVESGGGYPPSRVGVGPPAEPRPAHAKPGSTSLWRRWREV